MKSTARAPRSRWVGPPVPARKNELSRSPFGRQRHYGAVELAGAGEQVNVNDVVEVMESKQQQETSQRHPVLVQVLAMWEDTFTGVFKFRARWLVQASDLPAATFTRLRTSRQAFTTDLTATGSKSSSNKDQHEPDEVFLINRVKDLEVRSIVKPITLCVSTSATPEASPGGKVKTGPRLTYTFCDKSGNFHPLEGTDPIFKRARVRQVNAAALASRADQQNKVAKNGKQSVKSNGWLLPKRGAFQRRGRRDVASATGGGVEAVVSSTDITGSPRSPPDTEIEASGDSGTEHPPNSEDGEWKEGEEDEDDDATDSDSSRISKPTLSASEGFKPRKSARQRKSQRSPASDAGPAADAEAEDSSEARAEDSSGAKVEDSPKARVKDSSGVKVEDCPNVRVADYSTAQVKDYPEAQMEVSEETVCPPPSTSAPAFQRRHRVSCNKRRGQLSPRPRRLAMPPTADGPFIAHVYEAPSLARAKSSVATKVVRPVRTRMSMGLRPKCTPILLRCSSAANASKASTQLSIAGKRKRSSAAKPTQGANGSDYPPLRTRVGKDYQTDIPDLLPAEERKQPHPGTGAKMVWRSVQDWDPQSRRMLAGYLRAAKGVVEAKQARPGVAVHVRLGGKKGSSGVDEEADAGTAGSYAVWAILSGREACGLVRVACSELAHTDIPKSAIQKVQSQEQALSALVNARCVLENFGPALQMLANDQRSPGCIEPWTITQVRTLENALAKDYDPSRRLHGWARPGMDMDREDFINLASVSEQVPGKTPAQVLSFYYRYLAAAEPLTDVVYGTEAAEARKQESISPVHEANSGLPGNPQLARGNAPNIKPKTSTKKVWPIPRRVSVGNTSNDAPEPPPKPKPRVIRFSSPKTVVSVVTDTDPKYGATANSVPKDDRSTKRVPSPSANDTVSSTSEAALTPGSLVVYKSALNEATCGGDDPPPNVDRGRGVKASRQGGEGGGRAGAGEKFAQQRRCAVRERGVSRALPPVLRDAEVLEVDDIDDADAGGTTKKCGLTPSGDRKPTIPSDVEAAARHMNSIRPAVLSWVAWQLRRQAASAAAPTYRQSGVLPVPPRSAPSHSDRVEGLRIEVCDAPRYAPPSEAPVLPTTQGEPTWEQPPMSRLIRHEAHVRRFDVRPSGGQVESGDIPSNGSSGPRYGGRRNSHLGSEPASTDDVFGSMAPCWRLLERAQTYMDKDQLEYMRGLILTHVRKPMSRDQLLERAESCLQEQGRIYVAFVTMFDRIDQPPQVPLYPTKRALLPRPQETSYSVRRLPDAGPIYTSPHGLEPPPQLSPPGSFKEQEERGPYSLRPVNGGGERGVHMRAPSQPHARVATQASGRVEIRRSIHPYDHNGKGGWRASSVGNSGINDAVGIQAEPPPHHLSPGSHHSEVSVNPTGYLEGTSDTGRGGGARMRNAWSQ